jgi:TFIIS helical bundle-like domain
MPSWDELFTTVETYDNMTIQYLQFSKIGKVMRHIQSQGDGKIPRDDEFKFKDRAKALVEKWHQILNSNKSNGTASTTAKGDEATIGTDPETDNMDVDAKGDPEVADDKENIPENEDAVGEDANVSAMEGDITALADTSMAESNTEATT